MAQTPSTTPLYTVVQNISGASRFFGYLSAHGKALDDDEVYNHHGDLAAQLAGTPAFASLESDLKEGVLKILSTPGQILLDITDELPPQLALDNNLLGTVSPAWDEDGSSDFVEGYSDT